MQMSNPIAERYIIAVEREAERNRLYSELLAAQLANDHAAIIAAQLAVDTYEGEGDY